MNECNANLISFNAINELSSSLTPQHEQLEKLAKVTKRANDCSNYSKNA